MKLVLYDVDEESKENVFFVYSERIVFVCVFFNMLFCNQFMILKNFCVCIDCYNVFKIMVDIVGRLVVM